LAEWLQKLRHDHASRILGVTDQIALEWGRLAALRPRGDADGLDRCNCDRSRPHHRDAQCRRFR